MRNVLAVAAVADWRGVVEIIFLEDFEAEFDADARFLKLMLRGVLRDEDVDDIIRG